MLSGRKVELNLNGGHMTEYDVRKLYEQQQEHDRITALHANHGVLTVHYADGTVEVYKKRKFLKGLKKIRSRNERVL
jgi:hypothetical protein